MCTTIAAYMVEDLEMQSYLKLYFSSNIHHMVSLSYLQKQKHIHHIGEHFFPSLETKGCFIKYSLMHLVDERKWEAKRFKIVAMMEGES